jgi:hypothetical protein
MTWLVYTVLVLAGICAAVLWIHCLRDCSRTDVFSGGSKIAWRLIIILAPIAGPLAYLTAKKSVLRFSQPDSDRLARLLKN